MAELRAMIMAAGVGSRLHPLTCNIPKPLVPLVNRPVMEHLLRLLARYGYRELIANLWYLPERITEYFGDGDAWGVKLHYSREEELLGTAGGVRRCAWFLEETEEFLVISGDALTDLNLEDFRRFHRERGALATIALKEVADPRQFGVVVCEGDGRIRAFQEKPAAGEALSHLANTGIYLFSPAIFNFIPSDRVYDFGRELFPRLVELGVPFYGYVMEGYWSDVGSLEQYRLSNYAILRREVEAHIPGREFRPGFWRGEGVRMGEGVSLQGEVLLGDGVRLGPGVTLQGPTVIGDGCEIGARTRIEASVIWSRTRIGEGANLKEAVVGSECYLGAGSRLGRGVILSDGCTVGCESALAPRVRVWPGEVIVARQIVEEDRASR